MQRYSRERKYACVKYGKLISFGNPYYGSLFLFFPMKVFSVYTHGKFHSIKKSVNMNKRITDFATEHLRIIQRGIGENIESLSNFEKLCLHTSLYKG